ncbi:MAG: hypothetical protein ABC378_12205 [Staphylococcus pseudoxylosus]|nr:hypothetical protein BU103_03035 [Staphylococcus xylosus]
MKNSIFWSNKFIPIYFITALLLILLFGVYIQTDVYSVYLIPLILIGLGIASIIYNAKTNITNK